MERYVGQGMVRMDRIGQGIAILTLIVGTYTYEDYPFSVTYM